MKRELFYIVSVHEYWADVVFASFDKEEVEGFRKKTIEEEGYYYPEPQSILVEVPEAQVSGTSVLFFYYKYTYDYML